MDMTTTLHSFTALADADLLTRVHVLMATERAATAELVAALAELDARRLYLGAGCASLFTYCTQVLHLSESAAYARIEAARAARRHPDVLVRLADGRLTLTAVCLLARVLTDENQAELLAAAECKTKREIEMIVAHRRPQPPVAATVRKLPAPVASVEPRVADTPATSCQPEDPAPIAPPPPALGPARRPTVQPLAPDIYKVKFTLSREGHDRLRRAQDLLRHTVPNGDVGVVFERALTLLVADLERTKLAAATKPRPERSASSRSRHIPAAVKRQVWRRDEGRCAFVGTQGRCAERGLLEFHHVIPYADGGGATAENLQLRCAAHNAYEAVLWSGADVAREHAPCGW